MNDFIETLGYVVAIIAGFLFGGSFAPWFVCALLLLASLGMITLVTIREEQGKK